MAVVEEECECTYSIRSIDSELFRCFEGSDSSVTWRARLLGTSEVGQDILSSVLEDWVSEGGSVMVGGVTLSLVPQCSGQIDQLLQDQDGCQGGGESVGGSAGDSSGAVAGGVVSVLVVVSVITAVAIAATIFWQRR